MNRWLILLMFFLPVTAQAASWQILPDQSSLRFSGTHAGNAFTGEFTAFSGDIAFDPQALDQAKATISVDLTSARTGDATYDKTLPQADWLNSAQTPAATFSTTAFEEVSPGTYRIKGELDLRGQRLPVTLEGTIAIAGDQATFKGTTTLNRMDFGIGQSSDAAGDWVSLEIPLEILVVAEK